MERSSGMRIGFLLGAGVSLACGASTTSALTQVILRGDDAHRHTDGTYFLSGQSSQGLRDRECLDRIRRFLEFLNSWADDFFGQEKERNRVANYEDLYYLVTQLADAIDEYENPAISGLLQAARKLSVAPTVPGRSSFLARDRPVRRDTAVHQGNCLSQLSKNTANSEASESTRGRG